MPIVRTYGCEECGHIWEVMLPGEQWDDPAPSCSECGRREAQQQFRPVSIKGTMANARDIANRTAEQIAAQDYHVADISRDRHEGAIPKVRYNPINEKGERLVDKRPATESMPSSWGTSSAALSEATAYGRELRIKFGNGLDVLQSALKSGDQPDLIAASKRKSDRIW